MAMMPLNQQKLPLPLRERAEKPGFALLGKSLVFSGEGFFNKKCLKQKFSLLVRFLKCVA
jgi:hypothetical protein